eukprot:348956_1
MQIFIVRNWCYWKKITLYVQPNDTILNVKMQIHQIYKDIAPCQQFLTKNTYGFKKSLEDDDVLSQRGITNQSTLWLCDVCHRPKSFDKESTSDSDDNDSDARSNNNTNYLGGDVYGDNDNNQNRYTSC